MTRLQALAGVVLWAFVAYTWYRNAQLGGGESAWALAVLGAGGVVYWLVKLIRG